MTLLTTSAEVRVPATSANLGPGFDTLGVALGMHDTITARLVGDGVRVKVTGEGAGELPTDERHLIADVMLETLAQLGERPEGIELTCRNHIPQARGLGSSSAAIVAGIMLARQLVKDGPSLLDDAAVIRQAAKREGHPDNVSACVLGGFTIAWIRDQEFSNDGAHAIKIEDANGVVPIAFVPVHRVFTAQARAVLPTNVPLVDAAFNAARVATLIRAITKRPELLFDSTEDRLHQSYRATAMPETAALVADLRDKGIAAVVSGAGPSVLALIPSDERLVKDAQRKCPDGWYARELEVDNEGAKIKAISSRVSQRDRTFAR